MSKKKENKFEFALFVNGHKICGRYFKVDQYNPLFKRSINIADLTTTIANLITDDIRNKDCWFQYDKYDLSVDEFNKKWGDEIKSGRRYVEDNKRNGYG